MATCSKELRQPALRDVGLRYNFENFSACHMLSVIDPYALRILFIMRRKSLSEQQPELPLFPVAGDHTNSSGPDFIFEGGAELARSSLPLMARARQAYHVQLSSVLTISEAGIPSNSDGAKQPSLRFAQGIADQLGTASRGPKLSGQTLGVRFEQATADFLTATFPRLASIRPGEWTVRRIGDKSHPGFTTKKQKIQGSIYEQYEHLNDLESIVKERRELQAALGNAYAIAPDVVITRKPVTDEVINRDEYLVGGSFSNYAAIRDAVQTRSLLHAVISCKWTLRSDRAQNARSEALNLIRNRKGRTPHIAVVTAEPLPGRLASLALGTGDIDCVYHFALPELLETLEADPDSDAREMLRTMIRGKRLKDISDLPLDLAV